LQNGAHEVQSSFERFKRDPAKESVLEVLQEREERPFRGEYDSPLMTMKVEACSRGYEAPRGQ
jgi:hypothetical protein